MKFVDISQSISNWFSSVQGNHPEGTCAPLPGVELVALEERVLYSASPLPLDAIDQFEVADIDFDSDLFESVDSNFALIEAALDEVQEVSELSGLELLWDSSGAVETAREEIVIIDRSVADYQQLVDDITGQATGSQIRIEFIDSGADGVSRIAELLGSGNRYDAVHLVTHGSDGQLQLGNQRLDSGNLDAFADELTSWANGLSEDADILIYGCDVAASETGRDFVNSLAELSGADVAASDNLTGNALRGGDWYFEYTSGIVESELAFSIEVFEQWDHTLALVSPTAEDNGTARSLAADANGNTVIVFSSTTSALVVSGEDVIVSGFINDFSGALFPEFVANTTTDGDQKWASVAAAENGDFVVVWTSKNGLDSGLFARMFYADGSEKKAEFQIDVPGSSGEDATVSMDRFGNFVVAWEVDAGGTNKHDIFAQKFDSEGNSIGGIIAVNDSPNDHQYDADVSLNDQGEFVIAWTDWDTGNLFFQEFDETGAVGSNQEIVLSGRQLASTVDINNNGQFVVGYEHYIGSNLEVDARIYRPDGSFQSVNVNPGGFGAQYNLTTAILENGDVAFSWQGGGDLISDSQGAFYSRYDFDGGTDVWNNVVSEQALQLNNVKWSDVQSHATVTSARNENFVFGFAENMVEYVVTSFAATINQTPESSGGLFEALENNTTPFAISNFNYSDDESDPLSKIAIRTLSGSGTLYFQGTEITQADIDASPDGFVIDIADIADLTYTRPDGQYGLALDSFEYRVHDGNNFSVNNSLMTIDVAAEDRLWISTRGSGSAVGGFPDYSETGTYQLGGPLLGLGDPTSGTWSSGFNLDAFGLNIDGLHYVSADIQIGSGFQLLAGDILFSIRDDLGTLPVDLQILGVDINFNDEDVMLFRPESADFSTGTFSILLDMSYAGGFDSESDIGDLHAFSLVEYDTVIGDAAVSAGSFIFAKSGPPVHNSIYVMDVTATGENSTLTTSQLLIDGDDIEMGEKIVGLELVERATTIGGMLLGRGTLVVSLENIDDVGGNLLNVNVQDVFTLDVSTTTLVSGTATADAAILLLGSDVDLTDSTQDIIALAFLGTSEPISGTDATLIVNEDGTHRFTVADFGYVSGEGPNSFSEVIITSLPGFGQLIYQGNPVVVGSPIDISTIDDLVFVPDLNLSVSGTEIQIGFQVGDGVTVSVGNELTIHVGSSAGDVEIQSGTEFVSVDSWQINETSIGVQNNQKVIGLADGGYVVVWESTSIAGIRLFSQSYDSSGTKSGAETTVYAAGTEDQINLSATALADGGYLIVWESLEAGSKEIFGQRYDAAGMGVDRTGTVAGGLFQINQNETGNQFGAQVSALEDGGFVVSWSSFDSNIAVNSADVVARIYESNGTSGSEFLVNTTTSGLQRAYSIVGTGSGGFAIAWTDQGGDGNDVRARVFDQFGTALANDFLANTVTSDDQRNPVIARLGNNELVVVWQSEFGDSNSWGVFARRIGSDGNPIGSEIQVNLFEAGGQVRPTVVSLDDGSVLITWDTPSLDGNQRGLAARAFDASLNPLADEYTLNSRTYGNQQSVSIARLSDGDLLATWTSADGDNLTGGWSTGVFAERFATGVSGDEDTAISLDFDVVLTDIDGSEQVTGVRILGIPAGAVLSDGVNSITTDGSPAVVTGWNYSSISIVPPPESITDFTATIRVTTSDTDGAGIDLAVNTRNIFVDVNFTNDAGTYSDSVTSTTENSTVTLAPSSLYDDAFDPDTASFGTPSLTPDVAFDLDPTSPPPVVANVLTLSTMSGGGSPVDADFDATHVSFDPQPDSAYPAIDAALYFDGSGGGSLNGFAGGVGNASFELWFRPDDLTGNQALLEFGSSTNGFGLYLMDGRIEFHLHDPVTVDGNVTEPFVLTGGGISATEFNHVMVVIDSDGSTAGNTSSPGIALYINGVRTDILADIEALSPGFSWADATAANIGTTDGSFVHATLPSIESFAGSIAQLNFYDSAIENAEEVQRHMYGVAHSLGILTIEGQTPVVGSAITLGSGALVTLNADGSLTYDPNGVYDSLAPGDSPVVEAIDYEVTDGQGGVSAASVFVTVTPVNNDPLLGNLTVSLDETAAFGDGVADLEAADVDHNETDGDFTYAIDSGDPNNIFAINSTTGEITVARPAMLDFETTPVYTLTVSVTDVEGSTDTATLTVNLTNQAEPGISGTIFDDVDADGGVSGDNGFAGVTVHLYQDNGTGTAGATFVATTTTDSSGDYVFTELEDRTFYVVVESRSIAANGGYNGSYDLNDSWAQQTFGSAGSFRRNGGSDIFLVSAAASFGGADSGVSDDASDILTAQHVNRADVAGSDKVGIDFGFSFNVVTNVLDGSTLTPEQGSLRQFIHNANAITGSNHMRFVPVTGLNATGASGDWWQLQVNEALPEITDSGTLIDGQAWTVSGVERDHNATIYGDLMTADGTVGTGADGVAGTGDELMLMTATSSTIRFTAAGLDAPELEIVNVGSNRFGLVVRPGDDAPTINDIQIRNISIHGFGLDSSEGANIFIDGSGTTLDGLTDKQVSDIEISGSFIGVSSAEFADPGSLAAGVQSHNILVEQADSGLIFDNIIAFANDKGISLSGEASALDGADDWEIIGNIVYRNASRYAAFDGIDILWNSSNAIVRSNLISDNFGVGLDTWNGGNGHVFSDNTVSGNGHGGLVVGGIRVFGDGHSITHNVIQNNIGAGIQLVGTNSNFGFDFTAASRVLISQNSFSGNSGNAIDLTASISGGQTFASLDGDSNLQLTGSEIPNAMLADMASFDTDSNGSISNVEFHDAGVQVIIFGDGISENDGMLLSTSGNAGLDYVQLSKAGLDPNGLRISGTLDPAQNLDRIEVYLSSSASGDTLIGTSYGEGATYLGTLLMADLTLLPGGSFTGNLLPPSGGWPTGVTSLQAITTIAIDTNNNTSEFSNNVTINQVPVAVSTTGSVNEDATMTLSRSHFGFTDQAGATMTHAIITSLPVNGTLYLDSVPVTALQIIDMADVDLNKLTFVASQDYNGTDSIGFRVFDGQHPSLNSAMIDITVNAVNDAPDGTDITIDVNEDGLYTFDELDFGFNEPTANESDEMNAVVITTIPASGTLKLNGTAVSGGQIIDVADIPLLTFEPAPNMNGQVTMTFQVVDDGGTSPGQDTDQSPNTITFDVLPQNDRPVVTSGDMSIPENQIGVMILSASDIDGDTITYLIDGSGADDGLFTINSLTKELQFINAPDYWPHGDADGDGVYEVSIVAHDGTIGSVAKTLLISVTDVVAQAPVFGPAESFTIIENDSSQTFTIDGATDPEGEAITYSLETTGDHGLFNFDPATRTLSFASTPDFENPLDIGGNNNYQVMIRATDASGMSSLQTVSINVQPENEHAPVITSSLNVAIGENTTNVMQVTATDADLPAQGISFSLGNGQDSDLFTINSVTGQLEFISAPDFDDPEDSNEDNVYRVRVIATDEFGLKTRNTINVSVLDSNDLPVAAGETFVVNEGQRFVSSVSVLQNDIDNAGGGLTVSLITPPAFGTLTLNANGTFVYQHDGTYELGTDDLFVYQITDVFGQTSRATVSLEVNAVDDPTIAVNDGTFFADSGTMTTIAAKSILANDIDPDNGLQIVIVGQPNGGTATVNGNGDLVFTPDQGHAGQVIIHYVAVSPNGAVSNQASVTIEVLAGVITPTKDDGGKSDSDTKPKTDPDDVETIGGGTTAGGTTDTDGSGNVDTTGATVVRDNTADTMESEASDSDSESNAVNFDLGSLDTGYAYSAANSTVLAGLNTFNTTRSAFTTNALALSTFDPATLVAYWGEMDSAKHKFLMKLEFNTPTIAASVTSFLTVGYLAWIIRGGVLLTTFMSSIPAWQSFDPLPVIEQGAGSDDDDDDTSIEQMVD